MATRGEYIAKFEVDKSGAVTSVEEFSGSLKGADKSVASLRSQLREMQKELADLDPNDEKFIELSKQAGAVKDKMNDAAEAVKANAGPAFANLGNNFGLLKGRLSELDFEGVASSLKGIAGNISGVKFGDITAGIKTMGSSFAALGKALLTNPLFLILTGIALIATNFETIGTLIDGVTDKELAQLEIQKEKAALSKEELDNISAQENILRLEGKSQAEILKLKEKAVDAAILDQKTAIETQKFLLKSQVEAAERNKKILSGILQFITIPIQSILAGVDAIGKAVGKDFGLRDAFNETVSSLVFDPKEIQSEGDAALKEQEKALVALENQRAGFILSQRDAARDAADKRKAEREKELEEDIAARLAASKAAEEVFVLQKKIQAQINDDAKRQEAAFLQRRTEDELKAIEDQDNLRLELLQEGRDKEILLVDQKYIALRDLAHGNAELLKQLAEANGAEVQAINDKYNAEELKNKRATEEAKINLASSVIGSLGSLVDSFTAKSKKQAKAQFDITKGLNIARAILDTYSAANSALATTPGGPIAKGIAVAAVIGAGLANVNKIRKTKFEDSSVDTSGGGSSAASSVGTNAQGSGVPAFNALDTNFLTNRPAQVQPTYMLAGQAANQLEARAKIERQSAL